MIVSNISALFIWLKQPTIGAHYIIRNPNPGAFRLIFFRQWLAKLLPSQILMIVKLQFLIHIDIIFYFQISKLKAGSLPGLTLVLMHNLNICLTTRYRIVVSMKRNGIAGLTLQIQLHHLPGVPIMQINCTRINFPKSLALIHSCDYFSVVTCNQLILIFIYITHGKFTCRIFSASPCKSSILTAHFIHLQKYRNRFPKIREYCHIIQ